MAQKARRARSLFFQDAPILRCGVDDRERFDARDDASVVAPRDAPDLIGCADGTREAYVDLATYPAIAGCTATWAGMMDMRAPRTGSACGNDLGACAAPADACAPGWHLCASDGTDTDLLVLTGDQCDDEPGSFIAASSHCTPPGGSCTIPMTLFVCPSSPTELDCSQPICCGTACDTSNTCQDSVWPGQTHENAMDGASCGTTLATTQDGVLCCRGG